MSGPKVVRIVTREEHKAICQGMLARIDAALEEWAAAGRRNDCLDAATVEAARRRRDALAALAAEGMPAWQVATVGFGARPAGEFEQGAKGVDGGAVRLVGAYSSH